MKKPKRTCPRPQYGVLQVFIENGKVVFHPTKQPCVSWEIPPEKRVFGFYGCGEIPTCLLSVMLTVANMAPKNRKNSWRPDTGFIWCGWGWEMRFTTEPKKATKK